MAETPTRPTGVSGTRSPRGPFVSSPHGGHVIVRIECDEPWSERDLALAIRESSATLRCSLVGRLPSDTDPATICEVLASDQPAT